MTPADRAAAVAAAEQVLVERSRVGYHERDLARALLDLAATVERVEALCDQAEADPEDEPLLRTSWVRAALDGGAT